MTTLSTKRRIEHIAGIEPSHLLDQDPSNIGLLLPRLKKHSHLSKEARLKSKSGVYPRMLNFIRKQDVDSFPATGPAVFPKLVQIRKADDLVRYVYDFVPTLQGILDWSFAQLDRLNTTHSVLSDDVSGMHSTLSQTHDTILDVQNTQSTQCTRHLKPATKAASS